MPMGSKILTEWANRHGGLTPDQAFEIGREHAHRAAAESMQQAQGMLTTGLRAVDSISNALNGSLRRSRPAEEIGEGKILNSTDLAEAIGLLAKAQAVIAKAEGAVALYKREGE